MADFVDVAAGTGADRHVKPGEVMGMSYWCNDVQEGGQSSCWPR